MHLLSCLLKNSKLVDCDNNSDVLGFSISKIVVNHTYTHVINGGISKIFLNG